MKRRSRANFRKKRLVKDSAPTSERRADSNLMEWIKSFTMAGALFLLFRTFLTQAYAISSGSMESSLLVGDYLMANNAIYGAEIPFTGLRTPAFRDPTHTDVVVFRPDYNDPPLDVVKRVIGVPGDTIQMIQRVVYRNGRAVNEPYVEPVYEADVAMEQFGELGRNCCYHWHLGHLPDGVDPESYHPTRDNWGPLVLPENAYLMLGDNRDQSLDSRYAGFIPREVIHAKALFIYYSFDSSVSRPFPRAITASRLERIGKWIR